jgi:hypothetical protein
MVQRRRVGTEAARSGGKQGPVWYRPAVAPAVWYLCSSAVVRPLCCVGVRTKPLCANQVGMLPLAMPPAPAPVWAGGCPAPVVVQAPSPLRGVCGVPGEGHALFLMVVDGAAVLLYAMPPSAPERRRHHCLQHTAALLFLNPPPVWF